MFLQPARPPAPTGKFCPPLEKSLRTPMDTMFSVAFPYTSCLARNELVHGMTKKATSGYIWGQFHQRSTSSFFLKIPKVQKKTDNLTLFFALLGSLRVKAALRTLIKLTLGYHLCNFLRRLS